MRSKDVNHILTYHRRSFETSGAIIAEMRILEGIWSKADQSDRAMTEFLLRMIPIRLATLIEVHVRYSVARLIDGKTACRENCKQFFKSAVNYDYLVAVGDQRVTVGEIASQLISVNSRKDVIDILNTIEPDFERKLKVCHPRWIEEEHLWPLDPLIQDYGKLCYILDELFTVRHIQTHENTSTEMATFKRIPDFISSSIEFVTAIDWCILSALDQTRAKQATRMKSVTSELSMLEERHNSLINDFKSVAPLHTEKLLSQENAWRGFIEAQDDFLRGRPPTFEFVGSAYSRLQLMRDLYKEHINELEAHIEAFRRQPFS